MYTGQIQIENLSYKFLEDSNKFKDFFDLKHLLFTINMKLA